MIGWEAGWEHGKECFLGRSFSYQKSQVRIHECWPTLAFKYSEGDSFHDDNVNDGNYIVVYTNEVDSVFPRSGWLLKLVKANAIHMRATHAEIIIVDRNEFKITDFSGLLSHCLVYTSVSVDSRRYWPSREATSELGE